MIAVGILCGMSATIKFIVVWLFIILLAVIAVVMADLMPFLWLVYGYGIVASQR